MLTIDFAVPSDTLQIFQFIKDLAEYEKLSADVVATEEKIYQSLFIERSAEVLLAKKNQTAVGFALFFHNYSTFLAQKGLYLEDLFVTPQHRGHGIGKLLLKKLSQIALDRNCGRLEWAVLNWNQPAIDFYLSIGARPNHDWKTYRLTDSIMKDFLKET